MHRMTLLLHLFIALVIAGLVHLGGLFALPRTTTDDVFSTLSREVTGSGIALVPEERVRTLRFVDPNVAIGVCRFDLTAGPFRVRTGLSETFLAVVFAREQSGIITSVSDRAATSGALDVVFATPEQLRRISELDESGEAIEEIRVPSPNRTGIAIIKVLVDRPSGRANAETVLRAVQCGSEALPG
jgi:uncharacterized membrane protein